MRAGGINLWLVLLEIAYGRDNAASTWVPLSSATAWVRRPPACPAIVPNAADEPLAVAVNLDQREMAVGAVLIFGGL